MTFILSSQAMWRQLHFCTGKGMADERMSMPNKAKNRTITLLEKEKLADAEIFLLKKTLCGSTTFP